MLPFNLKKESKKIKRVKRVYEDPVTHQVKKVLAEIDQKLIVMVKG